MANIIKTTVGLAGALLLAVGFQHFTASPVVLQASTDSVAGYGEWLELRADGTFDYTSAGLFSEDIIRGRYTRTDSLIQLDQLPEGGAVKRKTLRVSTSPAFETGKGIWQVGPTGRIDSTLSRLRIVHLK
ncbi:hypothetical protein [Hymenobacter psoromatis]|uniref:hypothetical protein n=1 Tax=Hymenobacter psoromatis TaxID=1484116 RepID=UPI001CC13B7A|nr:hypothetical protein [Hymenobacter psoromatis]